jgi:hypothetical protein
VSAIELAATTIYMHYAITIRIIYKTTTVIRRYYYIVPAASTSQIFMGHQDLSATFDVASKESRAFTDLSSLELTNSTEGSYNAVISTLNTHYRTTFIIINIIYYRYRVFPMGNYIKVTLKNDAIVGNVHLISNNQPQTISLINWHQVPI